MKTPKQEAEELIFQYEYLVQTWDCYNDEPLELEFKLPKMKECAIITVKKIISASPSLPILSDAGNFVNDIEESTEYWKKVLKKIENYEQP
jgi:hypothetical protein